jgi:5-methylcytosine-specific restriction endonuclease McrA
MKIPDDIERQHIEKALREIAEKGLGTIPPREQSTKYDVLFKGDRFPPKYVIRQAHRFVDGTELPNRFAGGNQANNFLRARRFTIVNKDSTPIEEFVFEDEREDQVFEEGEKKYFQHIGRERNPHVARAAKTKRWRETHELKCDACGFDFYRIYGARGYRYIEAHHTVPISVLNRSQRTKLEDIALVCSNCHRMLHRSRPWMSVGSLRKAIHDAKLALDKSK